MNVNLIKISLFPSFLSWNAVVFNFIFIIPMQSFNSGDLHIAGTFFTSDFAQV